MQFTPTQKAAAAWALLAALAALLVWLLAELRRRLRESGALIATAGAIEWHCQLARDALTRAGPREPAATLLRTMIDNVSVAKGAIQASSERGVPA
ncbi:MAG: hypothetical protein ABIN37_01140 [Burkholderiaceae bacterium]